MATTTGSRYDHIAISDGSDITLHYLTDNRYPDVPNDSTKYLRGDGTWNTISVSSPYVAGTGTGSAVLGTTLNNTASGNGAVAEGYNTKATGRYSHAEGQLTLASAYYSHAEGNNTISRGQASHAEGIVTIAYGNYSHAEGGSTAASTVQLTGSDKTYTISIAGNNSLIGQVVRYNDTITYITAYSEIDTSSSQITVYTSLGTLNSATCTIYPGPIAIGQYSHAEGYGSIATGSYSHAEGNNTRANANSSHAEGYNTKASGQYQHVSGKYNVEDLNNTYAEIIGIGTSDSVRKNGRTLDWYGNEQLAGSLTLGLGTTDQITVTAAQLKQLIALLGGGGMIVNTSEVTIYGHVYLQMDKTFAQIVEAYKAGQNILVFFGNETTTYCYYPIEGIYCDTTFETDSQNIIVRGNYFKPTGQNLNSNPVCYNTNYSDW